MKNNDNYNPNNEVSMKNDSNGNDADNDNGNDNNVNSRDKYIMRELFGGAIITSFLSTFEDISLVRQVPDHQEVYVDRVTDMSLIVELLSYDESISDNIATQHYFRDLAQCNEATEYSIDSSSVVSSNTCIPGIAGAYSCCALVGRQVVAKFYRRLDSPLNNVQILLLVLRLPAVGTDILITLNIPHPQEETNIPTIATSSFLSPLPLLLTEPAAVDIMRQILKNFKIIDWSLFA